MSKKIYGLSNTEITAEEKMEVRIAGNERELEKARRVSADDEKFTPTQTKNYNEMLISTIDPVLENMQLPQGRVLIRLFRAPKISKGGIYIPSTVTYVSENSGQLKIESTDTGDIKYLSRAVIVKVAEDLQFKYNPGTVIDLYMASYKNITQFWSPLDRERVVDTTTETENYFTVPESVINFIWTNYQLPEEKENPSKILS